MRLKRRIAVVTGAAQGIGRAIAQRLSGAGAVLALLDKDGPMLEETARLESASAWVCNVSQRDQVLAAIEQITTTVGPIDILVNNAGIWRHTPVQEVGEDQWNEVFDVNVKGVLWCSQAVASGMVRRRTGKIVNIASVAGFAGNDNWSAYCASKAAALSLTLALSNALAGANVQVNAVCPGATQTRLLEYISQTELGSTFDWVHSPGEVAEEVLKLVCPFEQTRTGQVIAMKPEDAVLGIPVHGNA